MNEPARITPPRSWVDLNNHFLKALQSEWYRVLILLQDSVTTSSVGFWSGLGLRWCHLPVTTGSVSSPMGLGSDSKPVMAEIFGVRTYLADSMQFALEYLCRLTEHGAYYLMPSFRGEAADDTHLCQFFHSEAEIPGGLNEVMDLVEQYILALVRDLVEGQSELIRKVAGDLSHVEGLLDRGAPFRRITFDEAVEVLGGDPQYIRTDPKRTWRSLTRAQCHVA